MTEPAAAHETTAERDKRLGEALFKPFKDGPLELANRIVMAPMSRYFCPDEVPTDDVVAYYARRARGGAGLIISEASYIPHPSAHSYRYAPRFYGEDALAGWRKVIEAVHAEGGRMFPQLWHTGSFREIGMHPAPDVPGFGPAEILNEFEHTTHTTKAMTEQDIAEVIDAYATAAGSAQELGFDGVEIHGAHGYLIDTFFWHETNQRTDAWGGEALSQRARFGVEVVRAMRRRVGSDFPISFRWSQFKQQNYRARLAETPEGLEPLLGALADAGVSLFHCSARRFWEPAFKEISELTLAGWTRKLTGRPVIAVGSVGLAGVAATRKVEPGQITSDSINFADAALDGLEKIQDLEERLDRGEFDLIAIGRALLADPEWPTKVREGRLDERRAFDKEQLHTLF
jgi:2,4-dienoyl-CoA reductase-like NADH-dependent reductase (Old Yellow Enzyme family)